MMNPYATKLPYIIMEEYLRDRSKQKAVAVWVFNSINPYGETTIDPQHLQPALLNSLLALNPKVDSQDVEKIVREASTNSHNVV